LLPIFTCAGFVEKLLGRTKLVGDNVWFQNLVFFELSASFFTGKIGPVSFTQQFWIFGFDFGFRPNQRSNLEISSRCAALNPSQGANGSDPAMIHSENWI
jgi:hypothetical protein